MLVLHASWGLDRHLHLWGEEPDLARKRAARAARGRAAEHPFAAPADRLEAAMDALATDAKQTSHEPVTLLLPTERGRATSSLTGEGGTGVRAWMVPALAFEPAEALGFLLGLPGDGVDSMTMGGSVRYVARSALAALQLAARGRFLPALVSTDAQTPEARWLPVPSVVERDELRLLARAMPAVLRAESPGQVKRSPTDVLEQIVTDVVDAIARRALAGRPIDTGRRPTSRSPEQRAWLTALTAPNPGVGGDTSALSELADQLAAWLGAASPAQGPLRTCFRLSPPEAKPQSESDSRSQIEVPGDPWRLDFLVQATDDLSLLVPAADVWRDRRAVAALQRTTEDPQERLLADLGRASRLSPRLLPALREARPATVTLDAASALGFLRDDAPLLSDAGFGLMLPSWWRAGERRIGLRLQARGGARPEASTGAGGLGLDQLVEYEWQVALGSDTLSASELRELSRLKAPLVRLRGQWVELRADDLEAALRVVERAESAPEQAMPLRDLLRAEIGLGADADEAGLRVVSVEASGWLDALLGPDAADRRLESRPAPAGFNGVLRPYQERGLAWLAFLDELHLGACLADDMGLGKTAQVLALLVAERERDRANGAASLRPTLVVCPMSTVGNWQREAERFAPDLAVHVHHGKDRLGAEDLPIAAATADLIITTYGLVSRDQEAIGSVEWGRIVLDEAQNVKNSAARQSVAVRTLTASHRIALTGTPVENRLAELRSIMDFLNPGLLGSVEAFRTRFAVPIERYRDDDAADRLRRLTRPFILRRLKSDRSVIADLPDKLEMTVYCNLTREQATLYQAVVDDMLERIERSEGIERRGLILSTMLRLKQVCNHPAHFLGDGSPLGDRSGKVARLAETLEEVLSAGERALVFTQFTEFGQRIQGYLRERFGREVLFLHGGVPRARRDEMVARFSDPAGPSIFVLSLKAGGTGLNLTAASQVIHVDRWWNPAVEDQATDRAYRIGQTRTVQVRKLVCVGTLEERIAEMIESKRELADRVIGSGEGWLTELSTADLRDLVALSPDSVAEG